MKVFSISYPPLKAHSIATIAAVQSEHLPASSAEDFSQLGSKQAGTSALLVALCLPFVVDMVLACHCMQRYSLMNFTAVLPSKECSCFQVLIALSTKKIMSSCPSSTEKLVTMCFFACRSQIFDSIQQRLKLNANLTAQDAAAAVAAASFLDQLDSEQVWLSSLSWESLAKI